MNFKKATRKQLYTILQEECPLGLKNKAFYEISKRKERKVLAIQKKAAYSGKVYRVNT